MARVRVRVEDFETGRLPGVCVVSGQPTTTTDPFEFEVRVMSSDRSGVFNVLGAGVWELMGSRTAKLSGFLPTSDEARIRPARGRRRAHLVMLLGALVFVVGLPMTVRLEYPATPTWWVILGSTLIITIGGIMERRPPGTLAAIPDPTLRWIEIWPVSEEFVEAYDRLESRRGAASSASG